MITTDTKRLFITSGIFVTSLTCFIVVLFQVTDHAKEHIERAQLSATMQAEASVLLDLRRAAEESDAERQKIGEYFFQKEDDVIDFLTSTESLVEQLGVSLETSELATVVDPTDKSSWVKVRFALEGDESKLLTFIQALENFPFAMRILSVELKEVEGQRWDGEVAVEINLMES